MEKEFDLAEALLNGDFHITKEEFFKTNSYIIYMNKDISEEYTIQEFPDGKKYLIDYDAKNRITTIIKEL